MNINQVTILGANGTMGSNVAGIFAAFGNAKVYLVSRSKEKSEEAIEKIVKSVRADAIRDKLVAKEYNDLKECVENSELVFESVAEDFEIKKELLKNVAKYLKKDAIFCTGTSGLSINKMAELLPLKLRKRYLGMHFFNPPYNMSLCELIPSSETEKELVNELHQYAQNKLLRTMVVSKDQAAFVGNRIGFYLINRAIQYAEEYQNEGGIDYIDSIMGGFTGRNMPPIRTADFVGLDIHKAIVDNIYQNTRDYNHDGFTLPKFAKELIAKKKLGKKVGEGFYKTTVTKEGIKQHYVYDVVSGGYRDIQKYRFDFSNRMICALKEGAYEESAKILLTSTEKSALICKKLLVDYVVYSLFINKEVGESLHSADDAMATGFSWIPPLAVIDWLGGVEIFKQLVYCILEKKDIEQYQIEDVLTNLPRSRYDYRKFLKAKG